MLKILKINLLIFNETNLKFAVSIYLQFARVKSIQKQLIDRSSFPILLLKGMVCHSTGFPKIKKQHSNQKLRLF